ALNRFVDVRRHDLELVPRRVQQLGATRRCRRKDQAHVQMIGSIADMKQLQQAMPAVVSEILRAAPLSDGKVSFAWRAAVGPALERVTAVKLEGRVLLVDTQSPQWSHEIMRLSSVILRRLQAFLGPDVVERIEV